MSRENRCPLCGHKEHFEAETSLYECSNRRCKLSGLWFSGPEWRRLCKKPLAPAEVTTLEELRAAQRFNIPFVIPNADQPEQPLEMVTLRDRFAMAALTGLIVAYPDAYRGLAGLAHDAFLAADEMMKERKAQEADNGKASS